MANRTLRRLAKRVIKHLHTSGYRPLNRIELNRARVLHNMQVVQSQHPGFEVIPVLKSNAYGHGLELMAKILNNDAGDYVAVDGHFEAAKIRDITRRRILVMGYILPENASLVDTKRCSFVVQDIAGLRAFGALRRPVKIHMELNTGMNRLGLQPNEVPAYLAELKRHPNIELEGVMSHLADADNEQDDAYTAAQAGRFDALVDQILADGWQPKLIHLAQTAGSTKAASKHANGIRLGIGLYGINPLGASDEKYEKLGGLQPALELKSTIIKVLELKKGDKVSYNCTFTAPEPMRIGVLPLGYYEGVPRELSNKGCATFSGKELPIVGRVCMNHTMIDLGTTNLKVGGEITLISGDPAQPNSVIGIQSAHGLFAYTTLTRLADTTYRVVV